MYTIVCNGGESFFLTAVSIPSTDKVMFDDPVLGQEDSYFLSSEEAFKRSVQNGVYMIRKCHHLNVAEDEKKAIVKK